jgi:hypothetical protein
MTQFAPNSRYAGIETARFSRPDGETVVYLRRRFVPPPERFDLLFEHIVLAGERLDTIASQSLGDPELFWLLCDANRAMRPADLLEPGRALRITMPEGIPGASNG